MSIPRRGFLAAMLAAASAPAVVRASSLMPLYVPRLWMPATGGMVPAQSLAGPILLAHNHSGYLGMLVDFRIVADQHIGFRLSFRPRV